MFPARACPDASRNAAGCRKPRQSDSTALPGAILFREAGVPWDEARRRTSRHLVNAFRFQKKRFPEPGLLLQASTSVAAFNECPGSVPASRPAQARAAPVSRQPQPLYYVRDCLSGFGDPAATIRRDEPRGKRRPLAAVPAGVNWNYSKTSNKNSYLQKNFDHEHVLFKQHPLEKGLIRAVCSGSLVACAEVLGNCDRATEGGIPKSSRSRWFA